MGRKRKWLTSLSLDPRIVAGGQEIISSEPKRHDYYQDKGRNLTFLGKNGRHVHFKEIPRIR